MKTTIDISKRTKGEWQQKEQKPSLIVNSQDPIKQSVICSVYGNGEESEANAAFIVLACNNYDKLHSALTELMRFENLFQYVAHELQYPDNFIKAVNEAKQLLQSLPKTHFI